MASLFATAATILSGPLLSRKILYGVGARTALTAKKAISPGRFRGEIYIGVPVRGSRRNPDGRTRPFGSNQVRVGLCADVIRLKHGRVTRIGRRRTDDTE